MPLGVDLVTSDLVDAHAATDIELEQTCLTTGTLVDSNIITKGFNKKPANLSLKSSKSLKDVASEAVLSSSVLMVEEFAFFTFPSAVGQHRRLSTDEQASCLNPIIFKPAEEVFCNTHPERHHFIDKHLPNQ
ncbi:hypothetical protein ACTXT7_011980 [Hymenolepis weldensis]